MQNNNWRINDWQQRRLFATRIGSSRRRTKLKFALAAFGWMLLVLALLLSACTTQPQQPCEMQQFPTQPVLSEPVPSESYSEQWRKLAEAWRKKLSVTP